MLNAAKELSDLGFALHWLKPKSKIPWNMEWSKLPFLPFDKLQKTYVKGSNIGARLGEPSVVAGLYLHAIDLDIRNEEFTDAAHKVLKSLFPECYEWPCVISGSGGESRHFYFLIEKPFRSKKLAHSTTKHRDDAGHWHWDWEIELYGTGKQVVLPPSIHPITGDTYKWLREFDSVMLDCGMVPTMSADEIPSTAAYTNADDMNEDELLLALVRTPPIGLTEEEIRDAAFALPFDEWCEDRKGWIDVGMAIHHETEGSDLGFQIWCDFSERSSKFNHKEARVQWRSLKDETSNPKTMHSILKVLKEHGGDFEQCKQKLELCDKYRQAISTAAEYHLSSTEIDTIIPRLVALAEIENRVAKPASIKKDLAEARKEFEKKSEQRRQKSLEDWLADEVMRVFYGNGNHIKRFNKNYWMYDKGVWRIVHSEVVANRVYLTVAKILKDEEGGEGGALQTMLNESGRIDTMNSLVNAVVGLIEKKSANDAREDILGLTKVVVPSVVNCTNGELWFDDDSEDYEFHNHNYQHFLTNQIGTDFDPTSDCPEWDAALQMIFSNHPDTDDVIRHLHEVMGYLIQPQRTIASWFMFYGSGSNGKSFVTSILQEIMGARAWVGKSLDDFSRSNNSHIEAGLIGKLLLIDDDFTKGAILPDGVLKKLSEAKQITANPKNADEFNFVCRSAPLILTNSWPKTKDMSFGLERRAEVFHFNRTITDSERDMGLMRRVIENELPGVLNRLIDGWINLKARGGFKPAESCQQAKRAWLSKRNALAGFMSECLEVTETRTDWVEAVRVWEAFQEWSMQDNSGSKWGRNAFYDEVASIPGVEKYMKNGVNWFRGVTLKHPILDYFELIG